MVQLRPYRGRVGTWCIVYLTKHSLTPEDSIATGYPKEQKHYFGARTAEQCSRRNSHSKRTATTQTRPDVQPKASNEMPLAST
jgi:hypothetical protein